MAAKKGWAGYCGRCGLRLACWIPACAGMTAWGGRMAGGGKNGMGGILRAMRLAVGMLDSRLRGNDGVGGEWRAADTAGGRNWWWRRMVEKGGVGQISRCPIPAPVEFPIFAPEGGGRAKTESKTRYFARFGRFSFFHNLPAAGKCENLARRVYNF